jgi:pimeloyl-ACP methyl ester carboxylesterase
MQMTQLSTSEIPAGFVEKTVEVNGVTLNYAIGGTGPAVVLLHGYPQTWYMWRKVMPALAGQHTVIAPDLRGSGGSDAPATGYDKGGLAEDVHQLLVALDHDDQVSVVGHDIGGIVSYAYAAAHPDSVRRLAVIEGPQFDESLYQFPATTPAGPGFWNFGFFILDNGLPERIVSGREETWIAGFVDWLEVVKGAVDPDAVAEYAAHLRRPGHLAASYAYFRTFRRDVEEAIRNRETRLAMPVLAVGGAGALGQIIPDQAQRYAGDVTDVVLPCGHWVAEESPELLLKHLLPFLASPASTGRRKDAAPVPAPDRA